MEPQLIDYYNDLPHSANIITKLNEEQLFNLLNLYIEHRFKALEKLIDEQKIKRIYFPIYFQKGKKKNSLGIFPGYNQENNDNWEKIFPINYIKYQSKFEKNYDEYITNLISYKNNDIVKRVHHNIIKYYNLKLNIY